MPSASAKAAAAKTIAKKAVAKKAVAKKAVAKISGPEKAVAKKAVSKEPDPGQADPKNLAAKKAVAKEQVFLVAVKRRRAALRVYAVRSGSEAEALGIVEAASEAEATVEPVGRLSKKLAGPLKLAPREPRLI